MFFLFFGFTVQCNETLPLNKQCASVSSYKEIKGYRFMIEGGWGRRLIYLFPSSYVPLPALSLQTLLRSYNIFVFHYNCLTWNIPLKCTITRLTPASCVLFSQCLLSSLSSLACPPSSCNPPMILCHLLFPYPLLFPLIFPTFLFIFPCFSVTLTNVRLNLCQSYSSWWSTTCTGSSRVLGTSAPQRAACRTAPAPTLFPLGRSSHMMMKSLPRLLRNCAAKWRVCWETVEKRAFVCMLTALPPPWKPTTASYKQ